jgi:hypothetical protein
MIKKLYIVPLLILFLQHIFAQNHTTLADTLTTYLNEVKEATTKNQDLWNTNIYGPILLVNPESREVFANYRDSAGLLQKAEDIFTGTLPADVNIANTAVDWAGRRWAMIMLPLPEKKEPRINLVTHELFHKAQPALGFTLFNPQNNHLDKKDGRIYLRLELEALKKALHANNDKEMINQVTNALTFRKYRYSLYPGADTTENMLELNEGLAEYTGLIMSGRSPEQVLKHFESSISTFLTNPTFVRSFAYETTPVYGYLLSKTKKDWNRDVKNSTNLSNYFIAAFNVSLPHELKKGVEAISAQYNAAAIISDETAREEKVKLLIAGYKAMFVDQPHLEIPFEKMDISFDPRSIMPVEDKGTFYKGIRVVDNWGILTVENGAMLSPDWKKISVSLPEKNNNTNVSGDGWTLQLKSGYAVEKPSDSGNFIVHQVRDWGWSGE